MVGGICCNSELQSGHLLAYSKRMGEFNPFIWSFQSLTLFDIVSSSSPLTFGISACFVGRLHPHKIQCAWRVPSICSSTREAKFRIQLKSPPSGNHSCRSTSQPKYYERQSEWLDTDNILENNRKNECKILCGRERAMCSLMCSFNLCWKFSIQKIIDFHGKTFVFFTINKHDQRSIRSSRSCKPKMWRSKAIGWKTE